MRKNVARNCEICGNVIEGKGFERTIEGSTMLVCNNCARFGEVPKPSMPPPVTTGIPVVPVRKKEKRVVRSFTPKGRRKKVSASSSETFFNRYELVENYSELIRKARERKSLSRENGKEWTQEDLAKELNEKVSVIQKIETGRMKPSDPKLILKMEQLLDIKIHKPLEEEEYPALPTKGKDSLTLGEVVKFRERQKKEEIL